MGPALRSRSPCKDTFGNGANCLDDGWFVAPTPTQTSSPKVQIDKDLGLDLGPWADHGWVAGMGTLRCPLSLFRNNEG